MGLLHFDRIRTKGPEKYESQEMAFATDGPFRAQEVPGPPSVSARKACWRVCRAVLLMLQHEPAPAGEPKGAVTTCGNDCVS